MGVRRTVLPASEPITVAEAKAHLKVDSTDEDSLIGDYIGAAREACENVTHRSFLEQTHELTLAEWPCSTMIELPRPPLISITSVTYIDLDGSVQTVPDADYQVDNSSDTVPALLMPAFATSWPAAWSRVNSIKVTYKAGYATIPKGLKQAMMFLIGHYYEHRESVSEIDLKSVPQGIDTLLAQYKVWTIP